MPRDEFEYDLFLSHASEDSAWCENLAERLRDRGIRVWFDKWEVRPGHHLNDRIDEGLKKSRKLVALWTEHYFAERKLWTLAESYADTSDPLNRERRLIPILFRECEIKPLFRGLIYLDFRDEADFELRLHQLIEALDIPKSDNEFSSGGELSEHSMEPEERGRVSYRKGKRFEDEVATL